MPVKNIKRTAKINQQKTPKQTKQSQNIYLYCFSEVQVLNYDVYKFLKLKLSMALCI